MPKGLPLDALKAYEAARAPKLGMFSTLDDLVQAAPFEEAPADQWRSYLKPGQTLTREGVNFPLKSSELDDARLQDLLSGLGETPSKDDLLTTLRGERPVFNRDVGTTRVNENTKNFIPGDAYQGQEHRTAVDSPRYENVGSNLYHQSPGSIYEEDVTTAPDHLRGYRGSHFSPDTLAWSRATVHNLPGDQKARLIEEIQSDLHQDAAEKTRWEDPKTGIQYGSRGWADPDVHARLVPVRRGYKDFQREEQLTPIIDEIFKQKKREDPSFGGTVDNYGSGWSVNVRSGNPAVDTRFTPGERRLVNEWAHLRVAKPDAPFKDPQEYAGLEMRKQLMNAAQNDEHYLALVRGDDQIQRYGGSGYMSQQQQEGMKLFYDKIYPSVMRKLANQYGAKMTEMTLPVGHGDDLRPDVLRDYEAENFTDLAQYHQDQEEDNPLLLEGQLHDYKKLANQYDELFREHRADDAQTQRRLDRLDNLFEEAADHLADTRDIRSTNDLRDWTHSDQAADFNDTWNTIQAILQRFDHERIRLQEGANKGEKTFPAIELTPEVKDRIKKAGVSLFAKGGYVGRALELAANDPARERSFYKLMRQLDWNPRLTRSDLDAFINLAGTNDSADQLERLLDRYGVELPPGVKLYRGEYGIGSGPGARSESQLQPGNILPIYKRGASTTLSPKIAQDFMEGEPFPHFMKLDLTTANRPATVLPQPFSGENELLLHPDTGRIIITGVSSRTDPGMTGRLRTLMDELKSWKEDPPEDVSKSIYKSTLKEIQADIDYEKQEQEKTFNVTGTLKKAEGGAVSAHDDLKDRAGMDDASIDTLRKMIDDQPGFFSEERRARRRGFLGSALLSQLKTYDPKFDESTWGLHPGLLDEIQALPSTFTTYGQMLSELAQRHGIPLKSPPDAPAWSNEAADKTERHLAALRADMGVDEPRSWDENASEAAGYMLGQLPIPELRALKALKITKLPPGVRQGVEFFSPTIHPSLANYAAGTAFGTALGTGMRNAPAIHDRLSQLLDSSDQAIKLNVLQKQADAGDEKARDLLARIQDNTPRMAKGGLINFVTDDLHARGMTPNQYDALHNERYRESKNVDAELVHMTPREYIERAAEVLSDKEGRNIDPSELLEERMSDPDYMRKMVEEMKRGTAFAPPYLDYRLKGQDGIHRSMAAEALGEKTVPVVVIKPQSKAKGGKVSELLTQLKESLGQPTDLNPPEFHAPVEQSTEVPAPMGGSPMSRRDMLKRTMSSMVSRAMTPEGLGLLGRVAAEGMATARPSEIRINTSDVDKWLHSRPDIKETFGISDDPNAWDDPEWATRPLMGLLSEGQLSPFGLQMAHLGFHVNSETGDIHFTPESIKKIHSEIADVYDDLEGRWKPLELSDEETSKMNDRELLDHVAKLREGHPLERYALNSEDDIDATVGNTATGIDLIREYLKDKYGADIYSVPSREE